MSGMTRPSGCEISEPVERLLRFCHEEYDYYDAVPSRVPERIEPIDVLATVAVNAFFGANATAIRRVHRDLATHCDTLLPTIPPDADLLVFDPSLARVHVLLDAAIQSRGVLIPVATKVLHRKRPNLIPILDNVVLGHYLHAPAAKLPASTQDKARAASAAVGALRRFRDDLWAVRADMEAMSRHLREHGFTLSPVRVLEILVWTQMEERGYYR